jgi:hypothetical protein
MDHRTPRRRVEGVPAIGRDADPQSLADRGSQDLVGSGHDGRPGDLDVYVGVAAGRLDQDDGPLGRRIVTGGSVQQHVLGPYADHEVGRQCGALVRQVHTNGPARNRSTGVDGSGPDVPEADPDPVPVPVPVVSDGTGPGAAGTRLRRGLPMNDATN